MCLGDLCDCKILTPNFLYLILLLSQSITSDSDVNIFDSKL